MLFNLLNHSKNINNSSDIITKINTINIVDSYNIECINILLSYLILDIDKYYLTKNLQDEFTILFGESNIINYSEYYNKIWILEYQNEIFHIFTSKYETIYEIVLNKENIQNKSEICFNFIKKIESMLNNLNK